MCEHGCGCKAEWSDCAGLPSMFPRSCGKSFDRGLADCQASGKSREICVILRTQPQPRERFFILYQPPSLPLHRHPTLLVTDVAPNRSHVVAGNSDNQQAHPRHATGLESARRRIIRTLSRKPSLAKKTTTCSSSTSPSLPPQHTRPFALHPRANNEVVHPSAGVRVSRVCLLPTERCGGERRPHVCLYLFAEHAG